MPRIGPWIAMAPAAYWEQVGWKRQPPGVSEWMAGESKR